MTLREKIIEIITTALTADETILEAETLNANSDTIFTALELADRATDLFTGESEEYIGQVKTFLVGLPEDLPLSSIFPDAINLAVFLDLANLIDLDDLEAQIPQDLGDLNVREVTDLKAYNRDDSCVQLFVFEHSDMTKSFAFIDLTSGGALTSPAVPIEMMACALILVGSYQHDMTGKRWIISSIPDEAPRRNYVKYHLLLAGKRLTNAITAPTTNALAGIAETLTTANEYIQFGEPFEILGEINGRTTVLDKIMSCYHVLENYMIRAQIAKVANSNTSSFFGIRHFKQMELAVEKKEQEHLNELFNASWDISIGGQTLRDFVDAQFTNLSQHANFQDSTFQEFMRRLTVKKRTQVLNLNVPNELRIALPKIIYQVRCSLVHNKETEFHLSNRELLNPIVKITLTELCLPCMQRLAFGLPAAQAPNPLIYDHPALQLYEPSLV